MSCPDGNYSGKLTDQDSDHETDLEEIENVALDVKRLDWIDNETSSRDTVTRSVDS